MSDEKKDEKKEPQGCLVLTVVFLTAVLVLLVLVCYNKVTLSELVPNLPAWVEEQNREDLEKPVVQTQPKETAPQSDQWKEDVFNLLDQIKDLIAGQNVQPEVTEPAMKKPAATKPTKKPSVTQPVTEKPKVTEPVTEKPKATEPVTEKPKATEPVTEKPDVTQPPVEDPEERDVLVVIDAGHQEKSDRGKEPIGPGAEELKIKVSSGTQGVETGLPEYELNLQVATRLKKLLENRGYQVKMVRTTNDVNISNVQRAEFANEQKADVFVRIHANGDEKSSTRGIMTICQTEDNPYNSSLYPRCKLLSQYVLEETVKTTGAKKMFVWETDTMTGINWCQVPVTIIEMGYMTNPEEDKLLSTEDYQQKLAEGIANGIEKYLAG